MKKIVLFLSLLSWGVGLHAKPRTLDELKLKATEVLCKEWHGIGRKTMPSLQMLEQKGGVAILGNPSGGFAVMAIDDAFPAVMGYSHTTYDAETDNPGFRWWLNSVEEMTKTAPSRQINVVKPNPDKYPEEVLPFLKTHWGQSTPFNDLCPQKCPTGCVATAATQVLRYFEWPTEGKGSAFTYFPFADFNGKCYKSDLEEESYDYSKMLDRYDNRNATYEQKRAVAIFMYHMGLSMKAIYSNDGTGAYNETLCHGLRNNFSYPYAVTIDSDRYTPEEWMDIIFGFLSKKVPLIYGGADKDNNGHEFVLHGYDKDGMVYINWGWLGTMDGYFNLSSLLIYYGFYDFNSFQNVVVRCSPDWIEADTLDVEVQVPGTLSDLLTQQQKDSTICMRVRGAINSTDLKTLRVMAGSSPTGHGTNGNLSVLDLGDARIVAGGEPYLLEDGQELTTSDDVMPYKAFGNCSFLIHVTLPSNLVGYSDGVFAECINLENVNLQANDNSDFVVEGRYVLNKTKDELLECLPCIDDVVGYDIPYGIKYVHDYAFSGMYLYEQLSIPSTVERIGKYAFNRCFDLTHTFVYAQQPPVIEDSAIDDLDLSLRTLHVPNGTLELYQNADGWKKYAGNIVEFDAEEHNDGILETIGKTVAGNGPVYDIQGRKIISDYKKALPSGVYVVNGRKVMVR